MLQSRIPPSLTWAPHVQAHHPLFLEGSILKLAEGLWVRRDAPSLPAPPPAPVSCCPAMLNMYTLTFPTMANIVYLNKIFFVIYIVLELICKAMS